MMGVRQNLVSVQFCHFVKETWKETSWQQCWLICSFLSHGQYIDANAANANVNVIYQKPASKHTVSDQTAQVHRLVYEKMLTLILFIHFSFT